MVEGRAKLSDFGTCQKFDKEDEFSFCTGTLQFQAPESMENDVFQGKPCDIWAFGLTVYAFYYRKYPFLDESIYGQLQLIMKGNIEYYEEEGDEERMRVISFLKKVLDKDPGKRLTIQLYL